MDRKTSNSVGDGTEEFRKLVYRILINVNRNLFINGSLGPHSGCDLRQVVETLPPFLGVVSGTISTAVDPTKRLF